MSDVSKGAGLQASGLACAWYADEEVKLLGIKGGLCTFSSRKITRRCFDAVLSAVLLWRILFILHSLGLEFPGDLRNNSSAVGIAIKVIGLRPTKDVCVSATYRFLQLALPRGAEIKGISAMLRTKYHIFIDLFRLQVLALKIMQDAAVLLHGRVIRRLIYLFSRIAKRPHLPRHAEIRLLYSKAAIPLPRSLDIILHAFIYAVLQCVC